MGDSLQEIVMKCLACGTEKMTGTYTSEGIGDGRFVYSHGYCSMSCARKQYGDDLIALFSEYDNEQDDVDEIGEIKR